MNLKFFYTNLEHCPGLIFNACFILIGVHVSEFQIYIRIL